MTAAGCCLSQQQRRAVQRLSDSGLVTRPLQPLVRGHHDGFRQRIHCSLQWNRRCRPYTGRTQSLPQTRPRLWPLALAASILTDRDDRPAGWPGTAVTPIGEQTSRCRLRDN